MSNKHLLDLVIIIPARCGSKRIPLKNIMFLKDKPLLVYTIEAAKAAEITDRIYVSTNCEEIASVAQSYNIQVVDRPAHLAEDKVSTEAVLFHALDELSLENVVPEWVMTLPPTSPLRSIETVRRAVTIVADDPDGQDCLFTVTENRGDFWQKRSDGNLERLFPDAPRRQQDRKPLWEENSAVYLTRIESLRHTGSILGKKARGMIIDRSEAWDINTPFDILVAEALLNKDNKIEN